VRRGVTTIGWASGLGWLWLLCLAPASLAAPAGQPCGEPVPSVREAVRQSVLEWARPRYGEILQDVRVSRQCGDWALAVLVPRERINPAAVVVRLDAGVWQVVAGPGTAFPPEARPPGAPPGLFGDEPDVFPRIDLGRPNQPAP